MKVSMYFSCCMCSETFEHEIELPRKWADVDFCAEDIFCEKHAKIQNWLAPVPEKVMDFWTQYYNDPMPEKKPENKELF